MAPKPSRPGGRLRRRGVFRRRTRLRPRQPRRGALVLEIRRAKEKNHNAKQQQQQHRRHQRRIRRVVQVKESAATGAS